MSFVSKRSWLLIAAVGVLGFFTVPIAAEDGVTSNEIQLGQAAALQGPAAQLGLSMKDGLTACFNGVNKSGGINGRKIVLRSINDGYEPDKCELVTKTLIEKNKVFAMIGGVGTPTAKVAVPICNAAKVPFIGAFTGAELLRSPYSRYVVNLRGSYFQESERLAQYMVDTKGMKKIACFYQDDAFGMAVFTGIEQALERRGMKLCATAKFQRNTVAVAEGAASIAATTPDAVLMVGPYKPCAAIVKAGRANAGTKASLYCTVSFVGTMPFLSELGDSGEGVAVSQVVPFPWDTTVPIVKEQHAAMTAEGLEKNIEFDRSRVTWRASSFAPC